MMAILREWIYSSNIDSSRQQSLAKPGSFEELVRITKADILDISVRSEPGRSAGLKHAWQPVFSFHLPTAGDPLFNGPWGYRAQYWLSPEQGLAANAMLISALKPKLLAAVDLDREPDLKKINICSSLVAASAKFWIDEKAQSRFSRDLAVERWKTEAERGNEKAEWGLCAPEATKFEIKGALIDPYGNELVPEIKICRHIEIHNYGFS
jgi:hypothetical protein